MHLGNEHPSAYMRDTNSYGSVSTIPLETVIILDYFMPRGVMLKKKSPQSLSYQRYLLPPNYLKPNHPHLYVD